MKTIVLSALLVTAAIAYADAVPTPVVLDSAKVGLTFEGIGALSAGASSRLLIDYPSQAGVFQTYTSASFILRDDHE